MGTIAAATAFVTAAAATAILRGVMIETMNREWFPIGTLTVNISGSILAGAIAANASGAMATVLGTAAMGAFTTFSTFGVETAVLWAERRRARCALYVIATAAGAVAGAALGLAL